MIKVKKRKILLLPGDGVGPEVIAEVKKERSSNSSKFTRIAKGQYISPTRISKYCMSTIKLDPTVKHNRFKKKVLLINKLKQVS